MLEINLTVIDKPPTDADQYYTKIRLADDEEGFVNNLVFYLKQGALDILAECVRMDLIEKVHQRFPIKGYTVTMQRLPVNDGELSKSLGNWYFKRLPRGNYSGPTVRLRGRRA